MERLSDGKERAYASVLSVMQVMQKKELLSVADERDGLAHIFKPMVTREQVAVPLLQGLVRKIFGGSTKTAMPASVELRQSRPQRNRTAMRKLLDDLESRPKL